MELQSSLDHISARLRRIERLVCGLMDDAVVANTELDVDFLQLVLEVKCGTDCFCIRKSGQGFVVVRAVAVDAGGQTGSVVPLPDAVIEYVGSLAKLGAPVKIDLDF